MAFGVVMAGTGALSGMGGQKRHRVNRFRQDLLFLRGELGVELMLKALSVYVDNVCLRNIGYEEYCFYVEIMEIVQCLKMT